MATYQANDFLKILETRLSIRIRDKYGKEAKLVRFLFDSEQGEFAYEVRIEGSTRYDSLTISELGSFRLGEEINKGVNGSSENSVPENINRYHPHWARSKKRSKKTTKSMKNVIDGLESVDLADILDLPD